ncbi:MAG: AI-2E family transporter [Oscillospiraceae bacterium]|nr:AI-2E family transporter [Candidatus Ruminococcus equi]
MKNLKTKQIVLLITFTVILIFLCINIAPVWGVVTKIFSVLSPVIYGLIIAYILNTPFCFFYDKCFKKMGMKNPKLLGLRKALALLCSYVVVFGIIAFLIVILVPQISNSATMLSNNLPTYAEKVKAFLDSTVNFVKERFGYNLYDEKTYENLVNMITGSNSTDFLKNILSTLFPSVLSTAKNVTVSVYNWIIGIIFSIYMLIEKDRLLRQSRQVISAYIPTKANKRIFKFCTVCNTKCGKFIIGKIIDSLIIGVICFIGLTIFKFDYAIIISVVVAVTNLIPFFGPIIGAIPCAFLLLIVNPIECLWFIVFIIVLQQIDGNIIGPKILGDSVGISGFWIMFSVILGGGLFGLPGMLLGVPIFAVIYTLVEEGVIIKSRQKRIASAKIKANADTEIEVIAENVTIEIENNEDKIEINDENKNESKNKNKN